MMTIETGKYLILEHLDNGNIKPSLTQAGKELVITEMAHREAQRKSMGYAATIRKLFEDLPYSVIEGNLIAMYGSFLIFPGQELRKQFRAIEKSWEAKAFDNTIKLTAALPSLEGVPYWHYNDYALRDWAEEMLDARPWATLWKETD